MGTRIHTVGDSADFITLLMTELDADGYFGGYSDRFEDEPDAVLDGQHLTLLAFEDMGNGEAWVWRTDPAQLAKLIARLQHLHTEMLNRESDIEMSLRPRPERPPLVLDGGDLNDGGDW